MTFDLPARYPPLLSCRTKRRLQPAVVLLALLGALPGCSRDKAASSDPQVAQDALRQALELWKSGGSLADLRKGSQIIMSDVDWDGDQQLLDYHILAEQLSDGVNMYLAADLVLKRKSAKRRARVTYIVGTHPVITIHRD